jgi:O-antigen ligase
MKFLLSSWFSISVLIALILFIPYEVSFITFKPFDFWLLAVLIYNANKIILQRSNLGNIILAIAFLSVISTFLQASKDSVQFDLVFFSNFYRYFRLVLIIIVVKSIIKDAYSMTKIIYSFYFIGFATIIISIVQILDIAPLSIFFNNLYIEDDLISSLVGYGILERFGGILGNPNAMGILLCSFSGIALAKLMYLKSKIWSRVLSTSYFISILIIVAVYTSSRTSVLVLLFMITIVLYNTGLKRSFYFAMVLLIPFIFIASKINFDDYENLNRVLFLFESKTSQGNEGSIAEITGRDQLWQDRLDVFFTKGHDLALFFGMGFTKNYYDYADNGLLTYFINFGLLGLILKIALYVMILKLIYYYFKSDTNYIKMSVVLILTSLILFEFSSETIEHIKLGPLFIVFLQIGLQMKEKSITYASYKF